MNPRRSAKVAAVLCGTGVVARFAGFGSAGIENAAAPTLDRLAPFLAAEVELADGPQPTAMDNAGIGNVDVAGATELVRGTPTDTAAAWDEPTLPFLAADVELADAPQPTAMGNAGIGNVDVAGATELVRGTPTDTTAALDEPTSVVEAALTNSSQMRPPETPPVQVATASTPNAVLQDGPKDAVRSIEILDECLAADICIDRYLWALYQRTPKEDTIKVQELRKVTVEKKGKTVTVTKSFAELVDEDFTWKDPKAAERAHMSMMDYAIGGIDRSFKLKLFHMLHAAEEAGLSPGITSAFRDDYRQSIASGLKAATDRSYHGGSFRGGYRHGLAADVVSVDGETRRQRSISSENLWKWIDAHEKEFGVGRPYLDRDPAHVAPVEGKEYAAHRGPKALHAAVRNDENVVKRARSAKVGAI
jgi:hypothetical protein